MGMGFLGLDDDCHDIIPFSAFTSKSWEMSAPSSPGITISFGSAVKNTASDSNPLTDRSTIISTPLQGGPRRLPRAPHSFSTDTASQQDLSCSALTSVERYFPGKMLMADSEADLSFSFSPSIFSPGVHPAPFQPLLAEADKDSSQLVGSDIHSSFDPGHLDATKILYGNDRACQPLQRPPQPFLQPPDRYGGYSQSLLSNPGSLTEAGSFQYNPMGGFPHGGFEEMKLFSHSVTDDLNRSKALQAPPEPPEASLTMPVRRKAKQARPQERGPVSPSKSASVLPASSAPVAPPASALVRSASLASLNTSGELEEAASARPHPLPCKCKKSRCLKLYCDCFALLKVCGKLCSCRDCFNLSGKDHEQQRNAAIESIKEKNPLAFQTKISGAEGTAQHAAGCHCKQSHCLKKYCECFHGGANCGTNCKCQNCKNYSNSKELLDVRCRDTSTASIPAATANASTGTSLQAKGRTAGGTEPLQESAEAVLAAKKLQRTASRKRKESPTTVSVCSPLDESPSTSADGTLLADCSAMDSSTLSDKTDGSSLEQSPPLGTLMLLNTATPLSEVATATSDELGDCRAMLSVGDYLDGGLLLQTRPGPEQEALRRDRLRLPRPLKMKLASPLIYAASPMGFRHQEVHRENRLLPPCPSSSLEPSTSGKRRKVCFQAQTYPFFGSLLPETTKVVALICLDFLDQADLFSMSAVNSLWYNAANDEALWES